MFYKEKNNTEWNLSVIIRIKPETNLPINFSDGIYTSSGRLQTE